MRWSRLGTNCSETAKEHFRRFVRASLRNESILPVIGGADTVSKSREAQWRGGQTVAEVLCSRTKEELAADEHGCTRIERTDVQSPCMYIAIRLAIAIFLAASVPLFSQGGGGVQFRDYKTSNPGSKPRT